eukprot:Sspe_Gene.57050::Locus_31328_Transcript_1_2_Confidence_0.667_Length_1363::g.57050::m.57050
MLLQGDLRHSNDLLSPPAPHTSALTARGGRAAQDRGCRVVAMVPVVLVRNGRRGEEGGRGAPRKGSTQHRHHLSTSVFSSLPFPSLSLSLFEFLTRPPGTSYIRMLLYHSLPPPP